MQRVINWLLRRGHRLLERSLRPDFGVTLGALLLIAVGLTMRFYFAGDFEFKFDQMLAVAAAQKLSNPLTIAHGMQSSVGLYNFPGFFQIQSILGWFGRSVEYFHWVYVSLSVVTVLAVSLLRKHWPYPFFSLLYLWAATAPVLIYLSGNIWAQCLLPLFSIIILRLLADFWQSRKGGYFVAALIVTMFAGSVHMAGLLIFPGVLYLGWRRRRDFDWRHWLASMLGFLMIYGYYLFSLLGAAGCGFRSSAFQFDWTGKIQALGQGLAGGVGFWLFPDRYPDILADYFSLPVGFLLLMVAAMIPLWLTVLALRRMSAARKLKREVPALVRVSLVLTVSVLAGLLLIQCYFYYLLIIIIPVGVLLVYGSRSNVSGKYALLLLAVVHLLLVYTCLKLVADQGGDYEEYGVSYAVYRPVLKGLAQVPHPVKLQLQVMVRPEFARKIEPEVLYALFQPYLKQNEGMPVTLYLDCIDGNFVLKFGLDE